MENIKEIHENLSKTFKQLMNINKEMLTNLNEEQRKQILPIQKDINSVLKAVKNGDILAINEIQKKYADSNIR